MILSMSDKAGEVVMFREPVNPTTRNVEYWMGSIEWQMKQAVKWEINRSVNAYQGMDRIDWIMTFVGQTVLNGSQVHWTAEVEEAVKSEGVEGSKKYQQKCLG